MGYAIAKKKKPATFLHAAGIVNQNVQTTIANEEFQGYGIPVLPYFFLSPVILFYEAGGAMFNHYNKCLIDVDINS
jgi:hypothetical protein